MPKGKEYKYATKKQLKRLKKQVDENEKWNNTRHDMSSELHQKNLKALNSLVNKLSNKPSKKFRR
tara:strand:+ start:2362 stop:2556 length:195 start_codon:yes stop_codon:yes gene_type:complete